MPLLRPLPGAREMPASDDLVSAVPSSNGVDTAKPPPDIVQVALDPAGAQAIFDNPSDLCTHLDSTAIERLATAVQTS